MSTLIHSASQNCGAVYSARLRTKRGHASQPALKTLENCSKDTPRLANRSADGTASCENFTRHQLRDYVTEKSVASAHVFHAEAVGIHSRSSPYPIAKVYAVSRTPRCNNRANVEHSQRPLSADSIRARPAVIVCSFRGWRGAPKREEIDMSPRDLARIRLRVPRRKIHEYPVETPAQRRLMAVGRFRAELLALGLRVPASLGTNAGSVALLTIGIVPCMDSLSAERRPLRLHKCLCCGVNMRAACWCWVRLQRTGEPFSLVRPRETEKK